MVSWSEVQKQAADAGKAAGLPGPDFDSVRRKSYSALVVATGRPLIVYASAFHVPGKAQMAGPFLSLGLADKDGFQEVVRDLEGPAVDVFVHSPGGSAEAAESVVAILRSHFDDVRFIVTGAAKSAATMLVMSGNSILMTQAGELGPTDPQEYVGQDRPSPAGAILDQFKMATKELAQHPERIAPWLPILTRYGPSLLMECKNHLQLSESLVAGWLENYMFRGQATAHRNAKRLAAYLANDKNHLSHSRRVDLQSLRAKGAIGERVEDLPPATRAAVELVHMTIMAILDSTNAVKIFENSADSAKIVLVGQVPAKSRHHRAQSPIYS